MVRGVLACRRVKATKRCVKCGSRKIYFSACIMDRGSGNVAMPLAIGRADAISAHEVGQFEVYVCRRCGYSELYVTRPEELERVPGEERS
jgi:predicted nucleic-acid-binding Zn-ribbon protein